jgi:hypothetical protein
MSPLGWSDPRGPRSGSDRQREPDVRLSEQSASRPRVVADSGQRPRVRLAAPCATDPALLHHGQLRQRPASGPPGTPPRIAVVAALDEEVSSDGASETIS